LWDFSGQRKLERTLDLGCGAGHDLEYLASISEQVCGCDIAVTALDRCRAATSPNVALMVCDMRNLPCPSERFDAIVALAVINHCFREDFASIVGEAQRCLKPEGILGFSVGSRSHRAYGRGRLVGEDCYINDRGIDRGIPHCFFTSDTLSESLGDAWRILELAPVHASKVRARSEGHLGCWLAKR